MAHPGWKGPVFMDASGWGWFTSLAPEVVLHLHSMGRSTRDLFEAQGWVSVASHPLPTLPSSSGRQKGHLFPPSSPASPYLTPSAFTSQCADRSPVVVPQGCCPSFPCSWLLIHSLYSAPLSPVDSLPPPRAFLLLPFAQLPSPEFSGWPRTN